MSAGVYMFKGAGCQRSPHCPAGRRETSEIIELI
jgi:hypothetical protein